MSNIDLRKKAAKEARARAFDGVAKSTFTRADMKLRKLKLTLGNLLGRGQNTETYEVAGLNKFYGRENLCLKVFKNSKTIWGYPGALGQSTIAESSIVQNLMAIKGLAPRVYDLVEVDGKTAQVTDLLKNEGKKAKIEDDRFTFIKHELAQPHNNMDGKLVDFQGVIFKDFDSVKRDLLNKAHSLTSFPRTERQLYQTTNYCDGKRNTKSRLSRYKFPDFKGKTVFDVGCNLGMMMRAAHDKGAKRVIGLDWPDMVEISRQLAILDGYFNLDFIGGNIKTLSWEQIEKMTRIKRFDVHFFFAMEMWVGWPEWVKNCDTLFYEGHGKVRPFEVFKYD